jgi:predicted glycoside hydrolase/deacetylase ChbG (UPF0249 family)
LSARAKLLIVNADDFGFTRDVNQGILDAHRQGIVTAATLMASGSAFEDAAALARENPTLDVGCHLVLVGGLSALPPHHPLPASAGLLLAALGLGRLRVVEELRAQIRKVLDAGLTPTHLDTHKHTHLLPQVAEAVGCVAEEFGIRWVRRPLGSLALGPWVQRSLKRHGCRMTDHFEGFRLTGRLDGAALVRLLRRVRPGTTELMCHPGYLGEELSAAPTRLKQSRLRELQALTSDEAKQAALDSGIRLVNYVSLSVAAV